MMPVNPIQPTSCGGGRVLLLEDDQVLAKYFGKMLSAAGVSDVAIAHENETAIEIIENSDVIAAIVDVKLEFETSEKTAHVLKEHGIPFAFLSGRPLTETISSVFPDSELLMKPVRSRQIRDILTQLEYNER